MVLIGSGANNKLVKDQDMVMRITRLFIRIR